MRRKHVCFAEVVLFFLLLSVPLQSASAEAAGVNAPTDSYEFPVVPGTKAWQQLVTHGQMVAVCQVPDDLLDSMSTAGLVETVLRYPLFGEVMAYDNPQEGFDRVMLQFNGLPELFTRRDAGTELLKRYKATSLLRQEADLTAGTGLMELAWLESLVSQYAMQATLDQVERQELAAETRRITEEKLQLPWVFSRPSFERSMLILDRLQQVERTDSLSQGVRRFLETGTGGVEGAPEGHTCERAAEAVGAAWWTYVPFIPYTPNGSAVPDSGKFIGDDMSSSEKTGCNSYWRSLYPSAVYLGDCTYKYNCHSYAWYSSSTSNDVWIGLTTTTAEDIYWLDGSYEDRGAGSNGIPAGMQASKVSYVDGNHSAIVVNRSEFKSKWGSAPLMRHTPAYCPYNANRLEFYCRAGETCCIPNCANKTCGPDGCGGNCGTCTVSQVCRSGRCECARC